MTETSKTDTLPATKAEWLALCGARPLERSEVVAIANGSAARRIAQAEARS